MTCDAALFASHTDTVCTTCVSSEDERVAGACAPVGENVGEDAPFFSIVMPCYGVEAYIGQALECILKQTERSWELIVVDDATPDASALIAERAAAGDARIRVVRHERNLGLSGARNTGISQARGEYVWICAGISRLRSLCWIFSYRQARAHVTGFGSHGRIPKHYGRSLCFDID